MDFCANCGSRLTYIRKKEGRVVTLSCPRCGYEKQAAPPMMTLKIGGPSHHGGIVVIGKREQKLHTSPTVRTECSRCGNNLVYAWMVQVRGLEESSTQFFRCTRCNHTFRENS